jgi:hypothetical protein
VNNLAPVELKFKWKKNGEPIDIDANPKKYVVTEKDGKYSLKIKDFQKDDEANYEIYLTEPDDFDISSSAQVELATGKIV